MSILSYGIGQVDFQVQEVAVSGFAGYPPLLRELSHEVLDQEWIRGFRALHGPAFGKTGR